MKINLLNKRVVFTVFLHCFYFHAPHLAESLSKSYPITTCLDAKWGQTALYMEMSEYLADENPSLYWDFLNTLSDLETPLAEIELESKRYLKSISVIQKLISRSQLLLLKLVVSMHSLTPRIQAHFQAALEVRSKGDCYASNFATIGGEIACSLEELKVKLKEVGKTTPVDTYNFDHIYPGSENNTKSVVLYGDVGSKEFAHFHKYLVKESLSGNVKYINRHFISSAPEKKVRLSGYGVELHLKSTEYKSQDDSPKQPDDSNKTIELGESGAEVEGLNFSILKLRYPEKSHLLDQLRNSLLKKNEEITLLKAWEFKDLGLQAAQRVIEIQGEEALHVLQFTAQNFPTQAKSLLNVEVLSNVRQEIKHNLEIFERSLNIVPPNGALFVNGLYYDSDSLDLNSLVESLRSEIRVLESLHKNKIKGKTASSLLTLDLSSSSAKEFAIDIRDTAIMWINCIETDNQYKRWPSSFSDLLRPTFPGMIRHIRKNVFNLVLIIDPLHPSCRNLTKLVESFVIHMAPIRVGIVFDAQNAKMNDENSSYNYRAIFCAFNYITQKLGSRSALGFLTDLFAAVESEKPLTVSHIKVQLKNTFRSLSKEKIKDILSEDSDYDYGRTLAKDFVKRLGFKSVPQALFNGVPMAQNILNVDDFEDAVFAEIMQQTPALQKSVYTEELKDEDDAIEFLMNKPHVMPRLNQRILSNEDPKFLDFTGSAYPNLNNVRILESLSSRDMTATLMENIKYFCGKHSTENISNTGVHFLTLWIFADLDEKEGRELLQNALEYMKISSSMRVAFIPNVEGGKISRKDNLNRLVWAASQTLSSYEAAEQTINWLNNYSSTPKVPEGLNEIISSTELHMKMLRVYCQRVLNIKKSDRLILANGKIFGPLFKDENFSIDDFGLVDRIISHQYGDKIRKVVLSDNEDDFEISSDILLKICTTLVPRETKIRFSIPVDLKDQHSVVKLSPKYPSLPHFEITAVVDPASRAAQKLAPILILLRHVINCEMRVYLSPISQHSDMPVKNFYRFVIQPEVQFTTNGKYIEGPLARFIGLPANPLLTQNLQVPENWLVEVVTSVYDLDNIKLSEIGGPVHSEFELEYLLLEGHCYDSISGAPPRGLQVTLGTADYPTMVDTIVMANLGYFQLKANPGIWELRLREGKSANIYDITNAEGPNTFHVSNSTRVMISSLRSHVIKLRVTKKPTMINADLLLDDEETAPSRIWNKITSSFGRFSDERKVESDIINIFSVASGHLYERLLRIMMVSLLKHTKSPVKFWFLKNYLSPQFTDFLPHMAAEFDFQYELVQYKWPRWLHQQTEKQRTIWGYKILFLDVLFPLSVRKIIFVDADAIVRADIKELYDLDLHEAPYAYTPFCDSRKEMEGFRFWKQGYWRSHLMGRRYHISALYVVDLKKFRKIAAGDRLRGQYQALSQDPNSLSNLDQDLPNNMIHQVAIKSLPDEWLWCETWCSTDSLKYAKVIDLCNNPQTKEAKLTAAQRIVPEWKDYDTELKKLMTKIEDHENIDHSEAISDQPTTTQHNIGKDEQQNLTHHEEL